MSVHNEGDERLNVGELIEELKKYDPELLVVMPDEHGIPWRSFGFYVQGYYFESDTEENTYTHYPEEIEEAMESDWYTMKVPAIMISG